MGRVSKLLRYGLSFRGVNSRESVRLYIGHPRDVDQPSDLVAPGGLVVSELPRQEVQRWGLAVGEVHRLPKGLALPTACCAWTVLALHQTLRGARRGGGCKSSRRLGLVVDKPLRCPTVAHR